jgi:glycosyltransferase involved in cell wall biosynthesis
MTLPNVALFASSFAPHLGGVEELSRRLAIELRRRGSNTVVLTNRYPADLEADQVIDGIPVHRERFRFPEWRLRHMAGFVLGTNAARRGVAAAMQAHSSQLIHVQCVSSNGYYALRAARRSNLPLVVTMQGELSMDAGQAFQRSPILRREWRSLLTRADVVTGCSQQVVDEAIAVYGSELAAKARVVRNGIDVSAVQAAAPESRDRPYVFAIGRMVPQKGFDILIDAFRMVAGEFPDHELVIAGDGPDRAALEARAGGRVHFLGGVQPERAFSLYKGAAGFVLPSRHEPQGIVVIEAMAAGAPVLATRVGGVPETVHDGANGLLVDGDDITAMAEGLRRLLSDADEAKRRAEQAAQDVRDYDWARIADQYAQCYADATRIHRGAA